jgi:putative acetyltransferase
VGQDKTPPTLPLDGPAVRIIDSLPAGRVADAVSLVFEYMAATQAEAGRSEPASILQLPPPLRAECEDLATFYARPGALFIACREMLPTGCVGLAPRLRPGAAEVKRLYVRPGYRCSGIAHLLMAHVHQQATQRGFTCLLLNVMPARTHVIDFYRRLGYVECEPFPADSPSPMVYMQRNVPQVQR